MDAEVLKKIKFISVAEKQEVNLEPIYQAINNEKGLLHPTLEELQKSYAKGLSIVMLDGNEQIIGHVRFTPLLDRELKLSLGLSPQFPRIWEVGSAIIKNEFRGKGLYSYLRNALVGKYIEDIKNNHLLILGTTKTVTVLKSLPKAEHIGAFLQPCHHLDFPMIAAFTCVCKEQFGQGFQLNVNCIARINRENVPSNGNLDLIFQNNQNNDGMIPCIMYTSSSDLSTKMSATLQESFGSYTYLVKCLEEAGHYR